MSDREDFQLIASGPELRADDFAPPLWVPLSRVVRARRRVSTMLERLSADWWEADSACPGWRRRDVLAHLLAWDTQHLRSLDVILAGSALDSSSWNPDESAAALTQGDWDARAIDEQRGKNLPTLVDRFEGGLVALLARWESITSDQLLRAYGFAPNALAAVDSHITHVEGHADDIINGPVFH